MEVIEMLTCSTNEGRRQTKEFETIEFCPEPKIKYLGHEHDFVRWIYHCSVTTICTDTSSWRLAHLYPHLQRWALPYEGRISWRCPT